MAETHFPTFKSTIVTSEMKLQFSIPSNTFRHTFSYFITTIISHSVLQSDPNFVLGKSFIREFSRNLHFAQRDIREFELYRCLKSREEIM